MLFHEDLGEILDDLGDYLIDQEAEIQDLPDKFGFNPVALYEGLYEGQEEVIRAIINSDARVHSRFITLNYTTTLEKILNSVNFSRINWTVTTPLHIHGDNSRNMTIGVSDDSQLYAGMSPDEKEDLIKPEQIRSLNDGRMTKLASNIRASNVIVLFGTSIGITDRYLWQMVALWLNADSSRYLIIHKHDRSYGTNAIRNPRQHKLYIKRAQADFLNHSELGDEAKSNIKRRIFVVHNSAKLFYPKLSE